MMSLLVLTVFTDANSVTGASSDPAIDRSLTEEEMMEEFKKNNFSK